MSLYPFSDFYTTFKDLTSKALRVVSESKITGGYSPANLTMQNAVTANGNGTLLNVNEYATAVLEVRGTFSATVNFECSIDDTNWYSIVATKNDGTISSSCTTIGLYEIKVAGEKSVRARVSGYVSGNVTVVGKVSPLVNAEKSIQLTGSIINTKIITLFDALALRDTDPHLSETVDLSQADSIQIITVGSLNQTTLLKVANRTGVSTNNYNFYNISGFVVNNYSPVVELHNADSQAGNTNLKYPLTNVGFSIQASIAPTVGTLTVKLMIKTKGGIV